MATRIASLNIDPDLKKALLDIVTDIIAVRSPLAGLLIGSATYDASSLVDASGETTTVTVTGAAVGDFALASLGVDVAGITVTAYVSAANTVSVRVQNESGGTLDLASTTLTAAVLPKSSFTAPAALVTSKT
jgi:hypothetical protein